jgi:RNA polymerase sigma-70 factor (ECF subfamily)
MMLAGRRRADRARSAQCETMAGEADDPERARRFRDAALPHLDEAYTLARYLLRNAADAEDAVQDCYLRALKHFDTFRGGAIRPWLFAILRNVCKGVYAQRRFEPEDEAVDAPPLWGEPVETPETYVLRQHDAVSIQALVNALPEVFREVIVLREINDLSYDEIAGIVGVPIGTVMSRLARGRSMLRTAWLAAEEKMP